MRALAIIIIVGCTGQPAAPALTDACAIAKRLLDEATRAGAEGHVLRMRDRAHEADRACASAATHAAIAAADRAIGSGGGRADHLDDALLKRLSGAPETSLRARAATLDASSLVELGREEADAGHPVDAQLAFERAVARAETRAAGAWRWLASAHDELGTIVFSPDGTLVATVDNYGSWLRVWDLATGNERWSFRDPQRTLRTVSISTDGKWLAASSESLRVWDLATGKLARELADFGKAQFVPSGNLLAATRSPTRLDEIDLDGKVITKFATPFDRGIVASDRTRVVIADRSGNDAAVTVWSHDGTQLDHFSITGDARQIALLPHGELVVLQGDKVAVLDAHGLPLRSFPYGHFAVDPAGTRLAIPERKAGTIEIYDLAHGDHLRTLDVMDDGGAFAFDPRGGSVLVTAGYLGIIAWNVETGRQTTHFGRSKSALAITFDASGERLAIGSANGEASVWSFATGTIAVGVATPNVPISQIALAGDALAIGNGTADLRAMGFRGTDAIPNDATISVWDLAHGKLRWSRDVRGLRWFGMRPHSRELIAAARIANLDMMSWDVDQGTMQPFEDSSSGIYAWSADGTTFARNSVEVTPVAGGATITLPVERASAAAFAPAGDAIAITDRNGWLSVWTLPAAEPVVLAVLAGPPAALAWSPRGDVIASATDDQLELWDRRGARAASLRPHDTITSIAFRPDGRVLAIACEDGLVELWAVATATRLAMIAAPGGGRGLVFAPDGHVDGVLADDDPLFWQVGDQALPGRGAWDRARTPGLLATLLARVPTGVTPEPNLPGALPRPVPPACYPATDDKRKLVDPHVEPDGELSLCVQGDPEHAPTPLPICFRVNFATGAYTPRAPTIRDLLLPRARDPLVATVESHGDHVTVCRAGHCTPVRVPELAGSDHADPMRVAVDASGALLATNVTGEMVVYNVATSRVRSRFTLKTHDGGNTIAFVASTLIVTSTPCAGPCSSSILVDPTTGKVLAAIPVNTSELQPAQVFGDVWAFNDWDGPTVVYQDVRTGRVVKVLVARKCEMSDCEGMAMLHAGNGLVLVSAGERAGLVRRFDGTGKVVATYELPICK